MADNTIVAGRDSPYLGSKLFCSWRRSITLSPALCYYYPDWVRGRWTSPWALLLLCFGLRHLPWEVIFSIALSSIHLRRLRSSSQSMKRRSRGKTLTGKKTQPVLVVSRSCLTFLQPFHSTSLILPMFRSLSERALSSGLPRPFFAAEIPSFNRKPLPCEPCSRSRS